MFWLKLRSDLYWGFWAVLAFAAAGALIPLCALCTSFDIDEQDWRDFFQVVSK